MRLPLSGLSVCAEPDVCGSRKRANNWTPPNAESMNDLTVSAIIADFVRDHRQYAAVATARFLFHAITTPGFDLPSARIKIGAIHPAKGAEALSVSNSIQRLNERVFFRSIGCVSERMASVAPTQSMITKCVFAAASGVTACNSVGSITRTPRGAAASAAFTAK